MKSKICDLAANTLLLFALAYGFMVLGAVLIKPQEASHEMQAMSGKIMREVSEGLQCQTNNIRLAKENEALKARLKALEANVPAK